MPPEFYMWNPVTTTASSLGRPSYENQIHILCVFSTWWSWPYSDDTCDWSEVDPVGWKHTNSELILLDSILVSENFTPLISI